LRALCWLAGLRRLLLPSVLLILLLVPALSLAPVAAGAAEVLQVRSASLLQVGDQNRSYTVAVACLELDPDQQGAATAWLRQALPRRTRVNLKPRGVEGGTLVARVERLDRGTDLALDLVGAGFGSVSPECGP